ncbi:MAG: hypothetical protein ACREMA_09080 [Longimicrobiales bacterium]
MTIEASRMLLYTRSPASAGKRLALLLLLAVAGCERCDQVSDPPASPDFEPTEALLLSSGSPTKDEDPNVLRARDGSLYVAWFSDRGANADLYITRTRDGREWSAPVRVTTSTHADFYPNLIEDEQGMFHLVWFRWVSLFKGNIWYNSSADGVTWDPAREVQVTQAIDVDDWVPSITSRADGTLLVYFVSQLRWTSATPTSDLYVAVKRPQSAAWDPVVGVSGVNSPSEHDHLPVVARTGNQFTLVWVRHDTSQPQPWLSPPPKSDLFYATSADGLTWTSPRRITNESGHVVNVFPGLYQSSEGVWSVLWLSTRAGSPAVFELPLANSDLYPQGIVGNTQLPPGYSHRVVATSRPGVYLGVWVQGPDGAQDIHYRFFRK